MIKKITSYLFWFYIIALLIGDVIPNIQFREKFGYGIFYFRLDRWMHFLSYFGFCCLFILWKYRNIVDYKTNQPFYNTWYLLFFAAGTEILQILVPGRKADFKDFITNILGIIAGIIFCYFSKMMIMWLLRRKSNSYKVSLEPFIAKFEHKNKI